LLKEKTFFLFPGFSLDSGGVNRVTDFMTEEGFLRCVWGIQDAKKGVHRVTKKGFFSSIVGTFTGEAAVTWLCSNCAQYGVHNREHALRVLKLMEELRLLHNPLDSHPVSDQKSRIFVFDDRLLYSSVTVLNEATTLMDLLLFVKSLRHSHERGENAKYPGMESLLLDLVSTDEMINQENCNFLNPAASVDLQAEAKLSKQCVIASRPNRLHGRPHKDKVIVCEGYYKVPEGSIHSSRALQLDLQSIAYGRHSSRSPGLSRNGGIEVEATGTFVHCFI
jgi:hypothetical protein